MKKYILFIFLLGTTMLSAQSLEPGNQLYADGHYAEAAEAYRALLPQTEGVRLSADYAYIYYNLGNACFKQGELAQSILAYERALRLQPRMADARFNLRLAQSRIQDNIADTGTFFLSSWLRHFRNLLTENTWIWLSITLFWVMLAAILLFLLGRETWLRKAAFHCAWIMLLLTIISGANAGSLHHRDTARAEAIIVQGVVNAKSSPDRSGTDLFTLHEGTKVTIRETLGDWCNVRVGNNQGWMLLSNLERI